MPSGIDITRGRYATFLETAQSVSLGQRTIDYKGQRVWTYVRFDETLNVGDWVRDQVTADLVNVDTDQHYASVTTDSAIGTDRLVDAGAFDGEDFVGVIGQIVLGAGAGQTFFIQNMVDEEEDEVRISLLGTATELLDLEDDRGWAVALDNASSKYTLRFPGAVVQGDVGTFGPSVPYARGFVQQSITDDDIGKFGYVCSRGLCYARIDVTGPNIPVVGEGMSHTLTGRIQGFLAATTTPNSVSRRIAVCQHGDLTLDPDTGDALIMVEAQIDDSTMAVRLPDDSDPRIRVHIE